MLLFFKMRLCNAKHISLFITFSEDGPQNLFYVYNFFYLLCLQVLLVFLSEGSANNEPLQSTLSDLYHHKITLGHQSIA